MPTTRVATIVGFDSAWTATNSGAIAALRNPDGPDPHFVEPARATFEQAQRSAMALIDRPGIHLLAIDQPLVVKNENGMRDVDRVAASVLGRYAGGVQPASLARRSMFGPTAPIAAFLHALGTVITTTPPGAGARGAFAIEVFPALGNLGLFPEFRERGRVPKYNPTRKTFRLDDWSRICALAADEYRREGLGEVEGCCRNLSSITRPRKQDQDCLDAMLCLLTGIIFVRTPSRCAVLGDERNGFMVFSVTEPLAAEVEGTAARCGVAFRRLGRACG